MSEWIDVREKFPDVGQEVLVWFDESSEPYMAVWKYDGMNQYFCPFSPAPFKKSARLAQPPPAQRVTHWMPLPDPPVASSAEGSDKP
jgi:hypothetical protein